MFYKRASWDLKFAWLPHRCDISGKIIWLTLGYLGTAEWYGEGEPAVENHWHNKVEHLIWCLKNG
jgi:hypothetical protein